MDDPWFAHRHFTSLEIRKYKSLSDHTILHVARIGDVAYINKLATRIEQIPADGEMMISFSAIAAHVELLFYSGEEVQQIQIIEKKFKTPSTGFNFGNEFEGAVYAEIDALLFPAIDKILPKVENMELDFGNFSLLYKGSDLVDTAPVTLSFNIDKFTFKDKKGNIQMIEISSGQTSPQPFVITRDRLKISLLTFESKERKRLYPDFFQVVPA